MMLTMAARQQFQNLVPTGTDQQRRCARGGTWCSSRTRDDEGEWHAAAGQPLCPADEAVMVKYLGELPGLHERLGWLALHPVKAGRPVRVPPGSRVLIGPSALDLTRLIADQVGGWAARVRGIPQLSLSRHGHPHRSQEQVSADCDVLGRQAVQLLALAPGPTFRTWTFTPALGSHARPSPCRRCGLLLSPSPSGKYWWPAECTHAGAEQVTTEDALGRVTLVAWSCVACGMRLPAAWKPSSCRHAPSGPLPAPAAGIAEIEEEIRGLDVVRSGDDWVTCITFLGGDAAALDVFDLRSDAVRLLREAPAPRDLLEGIPCRACEKMESLEVLPSPPPDPEEERERDYSRCARCGDRMTRTEYLRWTVQYAAYTRGAGLQSCRRCALGRCGECRWDRCGCRTAARAPHPVLRA